MNRPKVSVLMPIYNTPINILRESINSILEQTFEDFEFLIVNDSPDNVNIAEFVRSCNDSRIRFFENKRNIGIEESTNFLIKKSRGEYLAIFDHDDISLPERLEKEVAFLDSHPDHGIVSGQFEVFGIESWTSHNPLEDSDIKDALQTQSCVSHTSLMIRAEVLNRNNIRYEKDFFPAASYRIITRLATVTKVANLPDLVLRYRMNGDNTSLKFADLRATARERIREEYKIKLRCLRLVNCGKFEKIDLLKTDSASLDDHHYLAEKDGEKFFIKESIHSFEWEFKAIKRVFNQDQEHFTEPIDFFKKDGLFYLVLRWEDGENLESLLKHTKLSAKQKKSFIEDIQLIALSLKKAEVVHRDVMPRNIMVIDGRLKLVDFYFAVDCNDCREYDYIIDDIMAIRFLGGDFAAGTFKWDDAHSFIKVIKYIVGGDKELKKFNIKEIEKDIGKRVITPDGEIFSRKITKQSDSIAYLKKLLKDRELTIQEIEQDKNRLICEIETISKSRSYRIVNKIAILYGALKNKIKSKTAK